MGGAHVFPGGRVDDGDRAPQLTGLADGIDDASARMSDVPREDAVAYSIAAVRELFEEAGVLLARDQGGEMLAVSATDADRFLTYRQRLAAHTLTLVEIASHENVRLALDALVYFAHWVTPPAEPRRYDTRFFAAVAPAGQQASHDQGETTHGVWLDPAEAIECCRRGEISLPPPTWTTLATLAAANDLADFIAVARTRPVPRIDPISEVRDGRRIIMLPGDPGLPAVAGFHPRHTRFLLEGGRWTPIDAD